MTTAVIVQNGTFFIRSSSSHIFSLTQLALLVRDTRILFNTFLLFLITCKWISSFSSSWVLLFFHPFFLLYGVTIDIRYFIFLLFLSIRASSSGKKRQQKKRRKKNDDDNDENTTKRKACSARFCRVDDKRIVTYTER